jgi:hypothetical protein
MNEDELLNALPPNMRRLAKTSRREGDFTYLRLAGAAVVSSLATDRRLQRRHMARWKYLVTMVTVSIIGMTIGCSALNDSSHLSLFPADWRRHKEILGAFEIWLPAEWESLTAVDTALLRLHGIVSGYDFPTLFVATGDSIGGFTESIQIQSHGTALVASNPLSAAVRCCVIDTPIILVDESDTVIYPDPLDELTIFEPEGSNTVVAHRSYLLAESS